MSAGTGYRPYPPTRWGTGFKMRCYRTNKPARYRDRLAPKAESRWVLHGEHDRYRQDTKNHYFLEKASPRMGLIEQSRAG